LTKTERYSLKLKEYIIYYNMFTTTKIVKGEYANETTNTQVTTKKWLHIIW